MKRACFDEIGEFQAGLTLGPKRTDLPLSVPYLRVANVLRGRVDLSELKELRANPAEVKRTSLQRGDVLIVEGHGNASEVGRAAIWNSETGHAVTHQNHIIRFRPDSASALPEYIAAYLNSPIGRRAVRSIANTTSGLNTISVGKLRQISLALPPLPEQRRIAAILDHADALRAKRRQVLAHLDSLTQSIFYDMFGDPDDSSDDVEFGNVATLAGGRNLVADDTTAESPYRVLKISAVTSGQFRPAESKPLPADYVPPASHLVRTGDLLMSRANTTELVGATAYVSTTPDNLALPDKVWRFEWIGDEDPIFYHALLSTPAIRRRISRLSSGTGGSMKNISKAKLRTMPVPRVSPPPQREFAKRVEHVNAQRSAIQRALTANDELFASLQSRAFRGEL